MLVETNPVYPNTSEPPTIIDRYPGTSIYRSPDGRSVVKRACDSITNNWIYTTWGIDSLPGYKPLNFVDQKIIAPYRYFGSRLVLINGILVARFYINDPNSNGVINISDAHYYQHDLDVIVVDGRKISPIDSFELGNLSWAVDDDDVTVSLKSGASISGYNLVIPRRMENRMGGEINQLLQSPTPWIYWAEDVIRDFGFVKA